jgi:hypothetical protein
MSSQMNFFVKNGNNVESMNSMYNVDKYTDQELYTILDLQNPSDRELEAKIIQMIHKYIEIQTSDAKELAYFFQKIYERFFYEEENMHEKEEEIIRENIRSTLFEQPPISSEIVSNDGKQSPVEEGFIGSLYEKIKNKIRENDDEDEKEKETEKKSKIVKEEKVITKQVEYVRDYINPILKQTIKRIISIDSQYRTTISDPLSTSFTFNLSEPLRDVLSISLYSVQIPYTWYTISKSYGSNFIYLKAKPTSMVNGDYDYKIEIPHGNYSASTITTALNTSLQTIKNEHTDVSFGTTNFDYNQTTGFMNFKVDITNIYNENNYRIIFSDLSAANNFGFNKISYNLNEIKSTSVTSKLDTNIFIDGSNNYFHVVQYNENKNKQFSVNDELKRIKLEMITGTITSHDDLLNHINYSLMKNENLYNSTIRYDVSENIYYLNIILNRKKCINNYSVKTVVIFPEDKFWTSLFKFPNPNNELSTLQSENKLLQSNYFINNNPKIYFDLSSVYYAKTFYATISKSSIDGYTLNQYIDEIKKSITTTLNDTTKNIVNSNPNGIFNTKVEIDPYNNTFTMSNNNSFNIPYNYHYLNISSDQYFGGIVQFSQTDARVRIENYSMIIKDKDNNDTPCGTLKFDNISTFDTYPINENDPIDPTIIPQNVNTKLDISFNSQPLNKTGDNFEITKKIYMDMDANTKFHCYSTVYERSIVDTTLTGKINLNCKITTMGKPGLYFFENDIQIIPPPPQPFNIYNITPTTNIYFTSGSYDLNYGSSISSDVTLYLPIDNTFPVIEAKYKYKLGVNDQQEYLRFSSLECLWSVSTISVINDNKVIYNLDNISSIQHLTIGNNSTFRFNPKVGANNELACTPTNRELILNLKGIIRFNETEITNEIGQTANIIVDFVNGKTVTIKYFTSDEQTVKSKFILRSNNEFKPIEIKNLNNNGFYLKKTNEDVLVKMNYQKTMMCTMTVETDNNNEPLSLSATNGLKILNNDFSIDKVFLYLKKTLSGEGQVSFNDYDGGTSEPTNATIVALTIKNDLNSSVDSNTLKSVLLPNNNNNNNNNGIYFILKIPPYTIDLSNIKIFDMTLISSTINIQEETMTNILKIKRKMVDGYSKPLSDGYYTLTRDPGKTNFRSILEYINYFNLLFNNYQDDDGNKVFAKVDISNNRAEDRGTYTEYGIRLDLNINKEMTNSNFKVRFAESVDQLTVDHLTSTWYRYLKLNQHYDSIGTIKTEYTPTNMIVFTKDSTLKFEPNEAATGLYTTDHSNDIVINIKSGSYTRDKLLNDVNIQFNENFVTKGTYISSLQDGSSYLNFRININKTFCAKDYNVVFYDYYSFVKCYIGAANIRNISCDDTLGWILGYRSYVSYDLDNKELEQITSYDTSNTIVDSSNVGISILGDTAYTKNIYNYFLIKLDDYTQSHLNDGLITITNLDNNRPLPSYTSPTEVTCNLKTGSREILANRVSGVNQLTQNQIYAAQQILNSKEEKQNILINFSKGPYVKDIFGFIPIKTSGLTTGDTIVDYSGPLQNQQRLYFGPVNIRRMTIQLLNDKGDIVDLNGANWSFSFNCEQLYQPKSV